MDMDCRTLILMGGQGRRMGYVDKGQLIYKGEAFLERIRKELVPMGLPCVISTAEAEDLSGGNGAVWVKDILKLPGGGGAGPMGGIWSSFQRTEAEGFFVVSCDMPLFRREVFLALLKRRKPEYDALFWRTRDGRLHPVCGYYSRSCLPAMTKAVEGGDYRMMKLLTELNCLVVDTREEHIPDIWFTNVNTPEILRKLKERRTPVLAVSGRKNTGKTTLLEGLVRELSSAGIRTAVIKHDGHEFDADVPGRDSWRMKQAGAYGTLVYSGTKFSLVKEEPGLGAEDFFSCFAEADVILLEGQKNSDYLKVETVRQEISAHPVCRPETVLAYVSDGAVVQPDGTGSNPKEVFSFSDLHKLAELIVEAMDGYF